MESRHINLTDQEIEIILSSLEDAMNDEDHEYEAVEYEDIIYKIRRELDEDELFDVE
jgi:hypothetical protein